METNGTFTVSTTYDVAVSNQGLPGNEVWKEIWKIKALSKMRTFFLLVMHKRIMCNSEWLRWGFTTDGRCSLFSSSVEDVNHIFRGCTDAIFFWRTFFPSSVVLQLFSPCFEDWMKENIREKITCDFAPEWSSIFSISLWWMWRWCNDVVFSNVTQNLSFKIA